MRVLICLALVAGVAAAEDFKTPEAVARTVFKALKQNEFKLMSAALPVEEDFTWLLKQIKVSRWRASTSCSKSVIYPVCTQKRTPEGCDEQR